MSEQTTTTTTAPEQTPETKPAVEPKQAEDPAAEWKAKAEAAEKRAAELESKEKERAENERLSKLSAEQKAAELEQKLKHAERSALLERVRRSGGFADAVYDVVNPAGESEAEIKAAYEAHKSALDAYVKAQGVKAAPGAGTEGEKKPTGKDSTPDKRPYLVRLGVVAQDKAV